MSESLPIQSLAASPGRFMLLRAADEPLGGSPDPRRPRIRRYQLSRVGGRSAQPAVTPGIHETGDFSRPRRP